MDADEFIRLYPAAFFACHRTHTGGQRLTSRQWQMLSHLDPQVPLKPSELACHLGVSAATVSVALDRLEIEGLVERVPNEADGRTLPVRLTQQGQAAMVASSALDPSAVVELLSYLAPEDRAKVREALGLLDTAAKRLSGGSR